MRSIGLDLGGTNIKVAVVDGSNIIHTDQVPTHSNEGPHAVVRRLAAAGRAATAGHGPIDAVGVDVPGLFNDADGTILRNFANLPGEWAGYPLVAELRAALGVPVFLMNDARAFVFAEARLGAAAGGRQVLGVTLGTGIGGGLVLNGELHLGPGGLAGEIGHMIAVATNGPKCGCGNRGCLESVATAHVLAAKAGQANVADVFKAIDAGDMRAQAAVAEVAEYLGAVFGSLVTLLVLDKIVIGGGIAQAGSHLLDPIRESTRRHASFWPPGGCEIVGAALGPTAGAVGSALWAAQAVAGSSSSS
jgi:glucokinase